ncbi:MAG: phosphate/phosphite/phosphonate ABC transporter substrate-binding protein [Rhodocyclaceae bacterium]|jgi:phosphonate transport system substrate-binding protein|nr:phosphate/phosphite/phosphonate ABC transporter substrate-binding protein [Rhodocyclaceae bacterium]
MAWRLGAIRNGLGRLALASALLLAASAVPAQPPLQLGIFPYLPTATLLTTYEPLRQHLTARLKQPVETSTAPNFKEFARRCLAGEYDLAVIGSGLGRYIEKEAAYLPLVASRRGIRSLLVVSRNSNHSTISDLRNTRIATIDPYTLMTQLGRRLLRQGGLDPDHDIDYEFVLTPFNAAESVLLGETQAAFISTAALDQLPPAKRERLRILAESPAIPGIIVYARKGAPLPPPEELAALLVAFGEDSKAGGSFVEKAMLDGFKPVFAGDFKFNDAFLPEFRKLLGR